MGRVAYNIAGAAEAAGVTESIIIRAIKLKRLAARRLVAADYELTADDYIIMRSDIQAWGESLPAFYPN